MTTSSFPDPFCLLRSKARENLISLPKSLSDYAKDFKPTIQNGAGETVLAAYLTSFPKLQSYTMIPAHTKESFSLWVEELFPKSWIIERSF
jgi:hypothetical protein